MENEIKIVRELDIWLKDKFFKGSKSLIKNEVSFKISEFRFIADVIAIQSKSNVIHGFEVKSKLHRDKVLSAIWQTNSYYTNYKWLVINYNDKTLFNQTAFNEKLLGIGIIIYNEMTKDFIVWKQAKYVDGNFLKFLPDIEQQWLTINEPEKK